MRRVLVFGGRDYDDRMRMTDVLKAYLEDGDVVIHGGANGADSMGGDIATGLGHEVEVFKADWDRYGKGAGPRRNQQMLESGIDFAIGFPGGRGTADMLSRLQGAGVPGTMIK